MAVAGLRILIDKTYASLMAVALCCLGSLSAQEIAYEGRLAKPENGPPDYTLFVAEVIGAHNGIGSMGRDALGRLIVTSGPSLLTFDGGNWTIYDQFMGGKGMLCDLITTEVGPDGRLYASTDRGIFRVEFLPRNRFELVAIGDSNEGNPEAYYGLLDAFVSGEHLFFVSPNKIVRYTPRTDKLELIKSVGVSISHARSEEATVVTYGFDNRVSRFTGDVWNEVYPYAENHYEKMIQSSAKWGDSQQMLGSVGGGIFVSEGDSIERWEIEDIGRDDFGVLDLEVVNEELIAASIQGFGVALINREGKIVQLLSKTQDYRLSAAEELVYTGGNTVWARFDQGVACIRFLEPLSNYLPVSPVPLVLPIPYRNGDELYLISSRRLMKVDYFEGGALKEIRLLDTVEGGEVTDCVFTEEGILYGTGEGVYLYRKDGSNELILQTEKEVCRLLRNTSDPDRVIVTSEDYFRELGQVSGKWESVGEPLPSLGFVYEYTVGAKGDFGLELGPGKAGRVWFEDGEIRMRAFSEADGLPPSWINVWTADGELMLTSGETDKVLKWSNEADALVPATEMQRLLTSTFPGVTRPSVAANGDIWVARGSGQGVLRKQFDGSYHADRFPLKRISDTMLLQAKQGAEGVVWLRGRRELFRYDQSLEGKTAVTSAPYIYQIEGLDFDGFVANRSGGEELQSMTLPFEQNSLQFNFASTSDRIGLGVTHLVQLEGQSRQWKNVGTRNSVSYANLSGGSYVFKVRSSFDGRTYGPTSVVAFEIRPPIYRSGAAIAAYAVVFILIAWGTNAYLRRRTTRMNKKLKSLVSERTEDLKLANSNLQAMCEKANVANESKSAFLAVISHEMRTPLNAIIGPAQVLLSKEKDSEKLVFLEMIQKAGTNLLDFVEDVLEFAASGRKETPVEEATFNLRTLVKELRDSHGIRADQKGVGMEWSMDESLEDLWVGDAKLIGQIASNFLVNALKFTEKGKISLEVEEEGKSGGVHWIRISVTDTGIGIPEDEKDRVFDPFHQVDKSLTREHEGAGLGLAICKQLAARLRGSINFKSEYGKGSIFWMTIPLMLAGRERGLEKTEAAAAADGKSLANRRVLLVDDNESNLIVAREMLKNLDCAVVTARNGREAVDMADTTKFDLILMDLKMPDLNGIEATAEIRAGDSSNSKTPIVALSAFLSDGMRDECQEAGIDRYLSKPIAVNRLSAVLSEALNS